MKKLLCGVLVLCSTISLTLGSVVFATSIDESSNLATLTQNKSIDYADLLKNHNIKDIIKIIEDYKVNNPQATIEQVNAYFKNQIISGELNTPDINTTKDNSLITALVDWSNYLPTSSGELSSYEKEVFNSNPVYGAYCLNDAAVAVSRTSDLWSDACGYHNDNADAFRHSYWNALMSFDCGTSYAQKFADAHEKGSPNGALEASMDKNNNSVGRSIGVSKSYSYPNPMAHFAAIEKDVLSAIKNGKMKRFVGTDIGTRTSLVATNSSGLL